MPPISLRSLSIQASSAIGTLTDQNKSMPPSPKDFTEAAFVEAVEQTIAGHRMFQQDDRVLIGVSGGPDSVALVKVLIALAPKLGLSLGIAHLDHGLRGPAGARDAAFVTAMARQLDLPCHQLCKDVRAYGQRCGLSIEEAGRRCRYAFFEEKADSEGYHKIALGHHADDNAELVLMNLFRGSGPQGLTGIPPVRSARIVRPLITVRRTAILEYLQTTGTAYMEDQSNHDLAFLRNRIRHQLLPELKDTYNPNIIGALNRLSAITREEEAWLAAVMQPIFDQALVSASRDRVTLSLGTLHAQPVAAQKRLLRMALKQLKGELRRISSRHINHILALAFNPRTDRCLDLPDRVQVIRTTATLDFIRRRHTLRPQNRPIDDPQQGAFEHVMPAPRDPSGSLFLESIGGELHYTILSIDQVRPFGAPGQKAAFFDMDKLRFPLLVRNIRPGDRFHPLGVGGSQKVKKYLIDHKIPRAQRSRTPVLISNTRIAWLVGHRIDDAFKIDAATQTVLKCELLLA